MDSEPHWLRELKRDMVSLTEPPARQLWPSKGGGSFFNYRLEHVHQVERDALRLLELVGGDREVLLAGVWLHDRFQPSFSGDDHGPKAADWAVGNLTGLGFPKEKVPVVAHAVRHHSEPPGALPPEALEARLLWDADKLAHLGTIEIVSTLYNAVASDRAEAVEQAKSLTLDQIARLRLVDFCDREMPEGKFYFATSASLASERFELQKAFARALCVQLGLRGR